MEKKTTQRETQEQKLRRIVSECLGDVRIGGSDVSNCNFVGVQFDAKAVDAITMIAEGLITNAKALGDLAQVLKASSVNVETMIKVGGV